MEKFYYVYMDGVGRFFITSEDIVDNIGWLFTGTLAECEAYKSYQLHETDTLEIR
jgi:hypothetical protein